MLDHIIENQFVLGLLNGLPGRQFEVGIFLTKGQIPHFHLPSKTKYLICPFSLDIGLSSIHRYIHSRFSNHISLSLFDASGPQDLIDIALLSLAHRVEGLVVH